MLERIVVAFHESVDLLQARPARYFEQALAVKTSAEVYGASLCSWGGETFAFDFGPDELDEALSFAIEHAGGESAEKGMCVGIAQGAVRPLSDRGSIAALSWGAPIITAERLARAAKPGEVLIDPEMSAVRSADLVTTGRKIIELPNGAVVRGLRLDVAVPYRSDAIAKVGRLREAPPLVGRDAELEQVKTLPGFVGILRAQPGSGGTRMLREARKKIAPPRVLVITPAHLPREPLAALRGALARAFVGERLPALSTRLTEALDALIAGQGIDSQTAADLVDAWLAPVDGRPGLATIDDIDLIDSATLDVVARALAAKGFALIVRCGSDSNLHPSIAALPVAFDITLQPLPIESAVELARAFCGGAITDKAAHLWARRGSCLPLGIREALAEGLSSGELRWSGEKAEPRSRSSGRGRPAPPSHWIGRRMQYLPAGARASLVALVLLGGDAPVPIIDAIACLIEGPVARLAQVQSTLTAGGWAYSSEPDWLAVPSHSAMKAVSESIDASSSVMWHRLIWRTLEHHVSTLALAQLAHHAASAEEEAVAGSLAASAAFAAANAGLILSASELSDEARKHDPHVEIPDLSVEPEPADLEQPAPIVELDLPLASPDDDTPVEPVASIASLIEATIDELPLSVSGMAPISLRMPADTGPASLPRPSVADAFAALKADPEAEEDPDIMAARLPLLAKQALLEGDLATLEQVLVRLRVTGEHEGLVERMGAFIALGRGNPAEAFRKLQTAEEMTGRDTRHRLSQSIALASVGAVDGALLETLDALAKARHEKDYRGEQACARFLAYLSAAMGQPREASVWARVAQDAMDAARG